jgi:hypothetical protein
MLISKKKCAQKVNEVVDCYCPNKWCLLKEILISKHTDPRFLMQFKCIEHLKFEESQSQGHDIGWNGAIGKWIDDGYAKSYDKLYDENLTAEQIYNKILKDLR